MISAHALINAEELRRQNNAAKLRRERLMRGRVTPVASIGLEEYSAHIHDFIAAQYKEVRLPEPVRVKIGRPMDAHIETYRRYCSIIDGERTSRVLIESVIRTVCAFYKVNRMDVVSHRRTASVVLQRQIIMYLAKTLTLRSLPDIGARLGGRDHTTILHGVRKIESLRKIDGALDDDLRRLTQVIVGQSPVEPQ